MRIRRLDLLLLVAMIGFGLAFVLGATWLGSKERARYRLEPLAPLDHAEARLVASLEILTSRFDAGVAWLRADAEQRRAIERRLATLDPEVEDPAGWLELAVVRLLEDRAGAAISAARHAERRHPGNPDLLLVLGIALERAGDSAAALQAYDTALEREGEDLDLLLRRGRLHLAESRFDAARADAERAALLAPRQPELQRLLGRACLATRDHGRAKRAFNDVLQLIPDDDEARRQVKFLDGSK